MIANITQSEIQVTPKMVEAGLRVLLNSGRLGDDLEASGDNLLVQEIFLSMLQAHPHETMRSIY